jgi:transposase
MQSNIISVDLAKNVFEVAVANHLHRIVSRHRLSRAKFSEFLTQHPPATVLVESCGTAHFWARQAIAAGHKPFIIPAQYVKPYRRRNKSDRIDTEALLEAHRCAGIRPVPVRSVDQ